jgi:hypothetical protein
MPRVAAPGKPVYPLLTVLDFETQSRMHEPKVIVVMITRKGRPVIVPYTAYEPETLKESARGSGFYYYQPGVTKLMHWRSTTRGWAVYGDLAKVCDDQSLPNPPHKSSS